MRLAICFERVDPDRGGAETYVADLCTALVGLGHVVDLYANDWRPNVLPAEVRCVRVPAVGWSRLQRIWNFAKASEAMLAGQDYDCTLGFINTWHQDVLIPQGGVHAASLEANSKRFPAGWRRWLYRAAKRANPKAALYDAIERRQYDRRRSTLVVAVSHMVRRHLEQHRRVPVGRVRVIPNAIDADRLAVADPAAARREFRDRLGLAEGDVVALFVGHNFRLKGLPNLLTALHARRARRPEGVRPIKLVVCGGGRLGPIERQVRDLGLGDVVHLVGFTPDVRPAYHGCDLFVLPSYYDPCSLVVLEALACGLPVITTAQNGAGELIAPGREGFVITGPDSTAELADALDAIADDATRRAMSSHAARLGQAQTFDAHVRRLLDVCEEVAASNWRPARAPAASRPRAAAGPTARNAR